MNKNIFNYTVNKVSDTVYCISDVWSDLMYLVVGSKKALLIDTGFGLCDLNELIKEITPLPVTVVLTHGHPDHAMGAYQFEEVYLNYKETDLFNKVNSREYRKLTCDEFVKSNKDKKLDKKFLERWIEIGTSNVKMVNEGDVFDLGGGCKIKVILSPGHTKGSICLLYEKEQALFSGDTILNCNHLLNLKESDTISNFHKSLKHLKTYSKSFSIIHPGHEKAPLMLDKLNDLIGGTEDIIAGNLKGRIREDVCGCPGIEYSFAGDNTLIAPIGK